MSSSILNQTEGFFNRLEKALGRPSPQNREVVAELRSDFAAQVEAMQEDGLAEEEAVRKVLEQMGEPEVLAAEMKAALPPLSSGWVRLLRYALAGGLMVWTLLLLWTFRAWDYGFSYGSVFALVLHLPVILLLWPDLIWRKNWLFGAIPAGIGVLVALVLNSMGTTSTQEMQLPLDGEAIVAPVVSEVPDEGIRWEVGLLLGALVVLLFFMIGALQRAGQRRMVLVAVALPLLLVEGLFQWEEARFRVQRDRLAVLVEGSSESLAERGTLAEAGIAGAGASGATYQLSEDGKEFTLWWSRPLSSGFAVCYSSEDDRIWVND